MHYITTDEELSQFITRCHGQGLLSIDTEFMREKTYYPRLCLLQMGTPDEVALIDPFEVHDLTPLAELLEDPDLLKLVHSGKQDIEILYNEVGVMPRPIFDVQVAASLLGHPKQVGYGVLVHAVCGITIDKKDSFTDWSRRPLTQSQLQYAANDVIYLPQIYRELSSALKRKHRLQWLEPEFEELIDPANYEAAPRDRYRRLKKGNQLTRRQLSAAREVAAWREERAMELDIPRKWVLTDEQIVDACKRETRTIDQLMMVRGVREKLNTQAARKVVSLISMGLDAPRETWPYFAPKSRNERNVDVEVDVMMGIVRMVAKENDIAFQSLANHESLQALARGHYEDCDLLQGWKREMVGEKLLAFLEGRLAIQMRGGRVSLEESAADDAHGA